jgi:CheY-like chemotaxis protein
MNAILGMTNLVLDTNLNDTQKEYVSIVKTSANNLLQIINDVLDFSKIEAGKMELENIDFNLEETISTVHKTLHTLAQLKNLEFTTSIDPDIASWIVGDPGRLRQVLINLTNNAIKFTHKGLVHISVEHICTVDKNVTLNFVVKDSGVGISTDKQNNIFDSFSQEDASTSRKYGGTGLGLTISSRIIQLMNSEIKLKSKVGSGSEFSFMLTFAKGKNNIETIDQDNFLPIKNNYKTSKILVVEDNLVNQKLIVQMLEKAEYIVDVADTGYVAIDKVKQASFGIILMDIQMPGIDGYETTKKIREIQNSSGQHTPIIALTAHALANDREKCLAAGMDEYLSKPIDRQKLYSTINSLLSESSFVEDR